MTAGEAVQQCAAVLVSTEEFTIMPKKKENCEHQFKEEPDCASAWENHYRCDDCGETWIDEWSCQCDDRCPKCDTSTEPHESREIASCACEYLK